MAAAGFGLNLRQVFNLSLDISSADRIAQFYYLTILEITSIEALLLKFLIVCVLNAFREAQKLEEG
jgi:hypothetical protein